MGTRHPLHPRRMKPHDIFDELDMLVEGSERTMLSIDVVNPMLAKINALINLRGEGGCRVGGKAELDVGADDAVQKAEQIAGDEVEVVGDAAQGLAAAESEELAGEISGAASGLFDVFEEFSLFFGGRLWIAG